MSNGSNKERIIGSSILLGGGLLLSAVFYRVNYVNKPELNANALDQSAEVVEILPHQADTTMRELTADYQTEQRILAQKKQERAERVAEQEKMLKEYIRIQEEANEKALQKANKEFNTETIPADTKPKEVILQPIPSKQDIERQKALDAKKQAEQKKEEEKRREQLQAKQQLERKQAKEQALKKAEELALVKKQTEKQKEKDAKAAYVAARSRLKDERAKAVMEGERGDFGVQVALAGSQALADDMAAKLKKYGYKVKTSQTTRGVRVIVGHEHGKGAAVALKDKINADSRLGLNGAWVMKLKPEHLKAQATKTSQKKNQQAKEDKLEKQIALAEKKAADKKMADKKAAEDKNRYGIQVAMAGTKEDAERLIAKLKKYGYKVTTSNTTRGTRIIVGSGLKKPEALKLQAKVNSDSRVGVSGAWMRRER